MGDRAEQFERALACLVDDVENTVAMEHALEGKAWTKPRQRARRGGASARGVVQITREMLEACKRRRLETSVPTFEITDAAVSRMARFTDKFKLLPYEHFIHYVPRVVNVVTVRYITTQPHTTMHSTLLSEVNIVSSPLLAVGRGHTRGGKRHMSAARSAPHRGALQELVLCAQQVQRCSAGLLRAALPRTRVP
jgi:hypothetical protein